MNAKAINGDWINELGSRMTLNVGNNNEITGNYFTEVGIDPAKNKPFPLMGKIHYPIISFIVDYENVDSVAAWVGMIVEQKNPTTKADETVIKTIWIIGNSQTGSEDERRPTEFWEAFNINQDTFRKP